MASYSAAKSVTATLAASTVDTVTLNNPYNVVTVINESTAGVISFTTNGNTPTAGGNDTFAVGPGQSLTVTNAPRLQSESSGVNGVAAPATLRQDAATVVAGSSVVLDASILSADLGRPVTSINNVAIPAGTFVGTVSNGVSFVLSSSATSTVAVLAVAADTAVLLGQPMVTAFSGSVFSRGVDSGNVLTNVALTTFPSLPLINLISAGTPAYTVIGG